MSALYSLNTSIDCVKGIGPKKREKLKKLGIATFKDVLEYYPEKYIDRSGVSFLSRLKGGEEAAIKMTVLSFSSYFKGSRQIQRCESFDAEGTECTLIFFNSKFLERICIPGREFYFYGVVNAEDGNMSMIYPDIIEVSKFENNSKIEPVYHLTSGISSKDILSVATVALDKCDLFETLPASVVDSNGICPYKKALRLIHFPECEEDVEIAKKRIIFEEFFMFLLGLTAVKGSMGDRCGISLDGESAKKAERAVEQFIFNLPYSLTEGQKRAIDESLGDMINGKRMNRLIQGDVGAGKTVIAAVCTFFSILLSGQAMILAPTEILANQHFESFTEMAKLLFESTGKNVRINILTSKTARKVRESIKSKLITGEIDLLIGTHAVLEESVEFENLTFVVTDEQHRFGVRQRMTASTKKSLKHTGEPHVMIMSATPIPRTLSLMIYGDMDISTVYDMPKGRKPVKTRIIGGSQISGMHGFIKEELKKGRRAYFVCPMIESSNAVTMTDVSGLYLRLKPIYEDFKISPVHGRMTGAEKDEIMEKFKKGEIDAVISTTVIEVGINVPEASVMVVFDADRFGLAQLHQLRGRVGRNGDEAWCFLLTRSKSAESIERLRTLCRENSGFVIAQKDLELRGSGEIFGTRQHGKSGFNMADVIRDENLLKQAQNAVLKFIGEDDVDNGSGKIYETARNMFENFSI